jgi:hypothetical protein
MWIVRELLESYLQVFKPSIYNNTVQAVSKIYIREREREREGEGEEREPCEQLLIDNTLCNNGEGYGLQDIYTNKLNQIKKLR